MRKFIVTSDKFIGQVDLLYSDDGLLLQLDMQQASFADTAIRKAFKNAVPVHLDGMASAFTSGTMVVETDFSITLEDFKKVYPYRRNFHLLDTRWKMLNKSEQVEAYYAAMDYAGYCKKNDWYKPKIADSWLAKKEFKNDWKKM